MLSIIGHKIIMQQGDDLSFRVVLVRTNGEEIYPGESDSFTLRVKRKDRPSAVITKRSLPTLLQEGSKQVLRHLFRFTSSDTLNIDYGDYLYDVTMESEGMRYTLVNNAPFSLKMSIEHNDSTGVTILNPLNGSGNFYLSSSTLVCLFDYVKILRPVDDSEDTLIIF